MTAIAVVCVTLSIAVPLSGNSQNLPNLGSTERTELSPQMERKLGEQIMRDIRRNRDYLDDAPVREYLNNFGASLLAAHPEARGEAGYDYFFFGVRDSSLNAFALPGGFIGVHSLETFLAANWGESFIGRRSAPLCTVRSSAEYGSSSAQLDFSDRCGVGCRSIDLPHRLDCQGQSWFA